MTSVDWGSFGAGVLLSVGVVAALMAFVLVQVARTGQVTVIDTVWGAGFAAVALAGCVQSWGTGDNALRVLVTVLTVVWGTRLAVHIGRRNHGKGEDPRYADIFARRPGRRVSVAARWVCAPQAVVLVFVSLPVQLAQHVRAGSIGELWWWFALAGGLVWAVGFAFETVGDAQLARFRADPANRGTVLDTGLWRYTRHPNYFGDACVWWGLFLCACVVWPGALTVLSPVLMTATLARGTGKPLMEKHLGDRPGYADYVARTSGFVPLPPKSGPVPQ